MKWALFITAAAAAMIGTAACSARRGEPFVGVRPSVEPPIERGRVLFMRHCHKCHPGGEAGLGPGINDKPLPQFLMKMQVRVGLGVMPSFHRQEITDQELDDLIRFLKALRARRA